MLRALEKRAEASKCINYFTSYSISVHFDFLFSVFHYALIIEEDAIMPSTKKRCQFHHGKKGLNFGRFQLRTFYVTQCVSTYGNNENLLTRSKIN